MFELCSWSPRISPPFTGGLLFMQIVDIIQNIVCAGLDPEIGHPRFPEHFSEERRVPDQIGFDLPRLSLHELLDPQGRTSGILNFPALRDTDRWEAPRVPAPTRPAHMLGIPAVDVACASRVVVTIFYQQNIDPVTSRTAHLSLIHHLSGNDGGVN